MAARSHERQKLTNAADCVVNKQTAITLRNGNISHLNRHFPTSPVHARHRSLRRVDGRAAWCRGRNHTFLKYHLIIVSNTVAKIWKWSKKRSTPQSFKGKLMSTLICNMWPNQGAMVTRRTTPYPLKGVQVTLE
jgi:hypothetical protein